jgi:hypothetical protein
VRESGRLFAAPTYFFVGSILVMLAVGSWRFRRSQTGAQR